MEGHIACKANPRSGCKPEIGRTLTLTLTLALTHLHTCPMGQGSEATGEGGDSATLWLLGHCLIQLVSSHRAPNHSRTGITTHCAHQCTSASLAAPPSVPADAMLPTSCTPVLNGYDDLPPASRLRLPLSM